MNIRHSWNYFWKKVSKKWTTWIVLFLHLAIIVSFFTIIILSTGESKWFLGTQRVEINETVGGRVEGCVKWINPKIGSTNDFFSVVFPNLIFLPILLWTYVFSPISWIFWEQFDDIGKKTQTDGTDLFFLSIEIPTSRKQIFWRKVAFLTSFFLVLHLIFFALPLSFLLWKANYFSNFTGLQTFLFLAWNFLITPLFLLTPLVVFLFSLASLNSVWYTILKWFGRLSVIFIMLVGFAVLQTLQYGGGMGEKILQWGRDFSNWLSQNYLLTTLTIMGVVICLAAFTLSLAYKDFQKKDLQ